MATNCDDLDLTRDEVNALKEAFKDKKFLDMFNEYAEEVTNPENVKKYENDVIAYERQHGNEAKFIHPEGSYVLKTSVEGERKAFINICTNSNVEKPSFKSEITEDGGKGSRWRLPHFLTPPRDDLDKSQRRCVVYDVIFHPDTIELSQVDRRFRKMINDIAIEEIENKFGVKLDKNNIRFPKMKYKGSPVSTITRKKLDTKDNSASESDDGLDDKLKELLKPPIRQYNYNKSNNHKKGNSSAQSNSDKNENNTTWSTPKYSIKYRNHVDIQDYTNMPHQTVNTRPQEIVLEINLPLLNSASHLNLDISEKSLLLVSEKKGANYKLDLALAYSIDEKEGKAQFDKSKRTLTVTLKVRPTANNLDLIEGDTMVSTEINDTKLLYVSDIQNSLDTIDENNKNENDDVKLSNLVDNVESSDIHLDSHFEEKSNIISELAEMSVQESSVIHPSVYNIQDRFVSELNEISERMDETLHIQEAEPMACKNSTGININKDNGDISLNSSNSIECQSNLDTLSEEMENQFAFHDCSKNTPPFSTVAYFPKFDYHQTSKAVTFIAQVKNIDPSSVQVCICKCHTNCWITFFTLGSGFVPFHYCLFLKFGCYLIAEDANTKIDLNENNLVIHLIKDFSNCYTWTEFEAGLNDKSLQRYEFLCEENITKTVQELKAESEAALNGDALLNEHVCIEDISEEQVIFDIKLQKVKVPEHTLRNVSENIKEEASESNEHIFAVEKNENEFKEAILPPLTLNKVRTSSGSSEDQSPTQRRPGILKYPRYWRTVSESSDDMFWSSMDNEVTPVGSLDSLGERPKKCVRFNDQVAKNVFRVNSSILGQRKKNQRKARNRKKLVNTKTNSDGTTETSEETSDCNSTSESTSDVNHTGIQRQKIYTRQQYKNVNTDRNFLSENIYSNTTAYHNMGVLSNDTNNKHNVNNSMYSQYPPTSLNLSSEDTHSHTFSNNVDMSFENSTQRVTNVKLHETGKSIVKEPAFTIMQRPQKILPRKPANLQQSEQSKIDFSFATNFKRTNINYNKMNDNKAPRNSRNAFQRPENAQGEAKQKGRRRRKWRNKNRVQSTPTTSNESCTNEPSYSILKSPNNFSDPEQFQSSEKRESNVSNNEGGNLDRYDSMITENFNNNSTDNLCKVVLNEDCKETTLDEHSDTSNFWQCKNDAEADAKYRTNCIVDFTNELMFQLD